MTRGDALQNALALISIMDLAGLKGSQAKDVSEMMDQLGSMLKEERAKEQEGSDAG